MRKARSRVKKSEKNATVERRVQMSLLKSVLDQRNTRIDESRRNLQQKSEYEPAHEVEAEGIEKGSLADGGEAGLNLEPAGSEDDSEGNPETTV